MECSRPRPSTRSSPWVDRRGPRYAPGLQSSSARETRRSQRPASPTRPSSPNETSPCTFRSRSAISSISIHRSTTPPTWADCFDRMRSRYSPIGATSLSATTVGRAPWSSPARRSADPPGSVAVRTVDLRRSVPRRHSTSSSRWGSSPATAPRSASRLRQATSRNTSSGCAWSTIGRLVISRHGSTSRLDRSSASPLRRRSRRGSFRWTRWPRIGWTPRIRSQRCCPICAPKGIPGSTCGSRSRSSRTAPRRGRW